VQFHRSAIKTTAFMADSNPTVLSGTPGINLANFEMRKVEQIRWLV
jgi:hypothetical protein